METNTHKTSCLSKNLYLILEMYLQILAVYLRKKFLTQSSPIPIWTLPALIIF